MPTVSGADERQVAGKQRVVGGGDPDRDDHECREDRLRDEELRHPLDVAKDPAALGDHRRDRREVAVDEHDVGDGLGHLRARALRDREARRLQRRDVVDPVPDHRHVAPVAAERLDDAPLSLRRDAAHDRQRRARAGRALHRSPGAPRRRAAAREPGCRRPSRSSPPSRAASPERTTISTPCSRRNAIVSRVSAAAPRRGPRGRASAAAEGPASGSAGNAAVADTEADDAAARLLVRGRDSGELPEREELGRAEHVAGAADRLAAPPPAGEERHGLVDRLARSRAAPLRSRSASGSAPRRRPRSGRARSSSSSALVPAAGITSTRRSEAVVSVPVLSTQIVSTDASDSIAFSCCDSAPSAGHAQRGGGIGHRDEQDEALGDERHHPGDGGVDGVADPDVLLAEGDDQHDPERHHHGEQDVEEPVDRALERRPGMPELAGRPRDPLGVALGTDRSDLERPGSLDDERPRPHLLADSPAPRRPTRRSGSTRRAGARSS